MDKQTTKVAFRIWPDGGVIAVIPELPATPNPYTCESYMHTGQHGECDPMTLLSRTRPATRAESRDLVRELRRIGYRVREIRRINCAQYLNARRRTLASI